jgi:hypothetical protein
MADIDTSPEAMERLEAEAHENRLRALSARVAELEDHISELLEPLPCACGHDNPRDICTKHMPLFRKMKTRAEAAEAKLAEMGEKP